MALIRRATGSGTTITVLTFGLMANLAPMATFAAIIEDLFNRIVLELPQLRTFKLGIKPGRDRASAEVSGNGDVVAGGEYRRTSGLDPNDFGGSKRPEIEILLLDRLAQKVALQFAVDVVDADQGLAGQ